MEAKTILNAVANSVVCVSVTAFMALLRRSNSPIEQMGVWMRLWIRISLGLVASGALISVLSLSSPNWSEVVINCGLAGIFAWAVFWHKVRWSKL